MVGGAHPTEQIKRERKMLNKISIAIASTALSLWGIASQAATVTETTDVGELLNTAGLTDSQPAGTSLDSISGFLGFDDIDLYQIRVSGGAFSATTTEAVPTPPILDTQLLLFNATGLGVFASDNASGDFFRKSTISGILGSGIYYIGVSVKGYNPQSSGGEIFQTIMDIPSTTFNPDPATSATGAGAAFPLSSWSTGFSESDNYTITFTGAEFVGPTTSTGAGADYEFSPTVAVIIIGVGAAFHHFRNKNK